MFDIRTWSDFLGTALREPTGIMLLSVGSNTQA